MSDDKCKNCGACKTCGAPNRQGFLPMPYQPVFQPYWSTVPPWPGYPTVTCTSSTSADTTSWNA